MNVDQAEINKFSQLAARWWDKNAEFKPLHDITPLRLEFIQKHTPLKNKKILDVGCGGGILCEALAQLGAEVTGIDMAEASIKVADLHKLESELSINYQVITAEEFATKNKAQFDAVVCLEMLEHVPDPASIVKACAELVKPNGDVFFSTINRSVKGFLGGIVAAEYLLKLLPKGTHEYQKFIKPHELISACRQSNLQVDETRGLSYNLLNKTYKLTDNVDINYLLHAKTSN